jgi:hypothetical protein
LKDDPFGEKPVRLNLEDDDNSP